MFRSIRWTLLFWYGLILVVVIAGFGATLYHNLARSMRDRLDARLGDSARLVFGAMGGRRGHLTIPLPERATRRFRDAEPDAPYYVIWDASGTVLARSNPSIPAPPFEAIPKPAPARSAVEGPPSRVRADGPGRTDAAGPVGGPRYRDRGALREVLARGPRDTTILVGQAAEDEGARLREFLGMVLAAGIGTLGLALVGGWFLAGRALAPIERISAAASGLSAENLSRRIDVDRTESELGRLASILNVTFDRLEVAFGRQVQFTADASHELRTPLAIVIAHAELALRKARTADEHRRTIETCLKAARRMESVVAGLLTLARADAHELSVRRRRVDLAVLVEEAVALLRPLAVPRGLAVEVAAEPVEVDGDEGRLREVVTNLVTNAIHYNRDGGRIAIEVVRDRDVALLRVADTGLGVAEDDLPHLFDRFYRANVARSRELGGSGLGLAITKWIVEAHGGTISVTSREGHGSTFTVALPASPVRGERNGTLATSRALRG